MIGMSTLTFLLMDDGSISMWILREPGENASSRPVMRSSNRAPMQIIRSQSCIAQFASQVPCMPSMPSQRGSLAWTGAEPHQRRGDRKAGQLHKFAQQMRRFRSRIDDAAAGVEQRTLGMRHQIDRGLDAIEVALELRTGSPCAGTRSAWNRVPVANCTSFGMSTTTGPGRPLEAMWNASCSTRGSSSMLFTR